MQRRRPLIFENVEADSAQAVDVGVVDASEEADLWWSHGVVSRKEEFESKLAIGVWALFRPDDDNRE